MHNQTLYPSHPASAMKRYTMLLSACLLGVTLTATANAAPNLQNIGYVPVSSTGSVDVIDMQQQKVLKKISNVGDHPTVLRTLPDRSKIYVDNFGPLSSQIGVIDTASNSVIKKIDTHGVPFASIQLSPDGRYLYVPTTFSVVDVIDTQTDQVVRTLSLPSLPFGIEVSSDGAVIYVNFSDNTIGAYSAQTGATIHPRIDAKGIGAGWTAISSDGKTLYIANLLSDNVSVLDTVNWKIIKSIYMGPGAEPISLTISPDGKSMYVCNVGTRTVVVVNTQTESVTRTIQMLTTPIAVGFSADSSRAYISDLGPATLTYTVGPLVGLGFFVFTPGLPSDILTVSTATGKLTGQPIFTSTGPIFGVYF